MNIRGVLFITAARSDELMLIQLPDTLPGIPFEKALNTKENISNSDQVTTIAHIKY